MLKIASNGKYLFSLLLYVGVLEIFFYWTIRPEKTARQILIENKESLEYPCCISDYTNKPRNDIVFLFVKGTRSSVMVNILAKFSLNFGLDVFIPEANSSLRAIQGMETEDCKYNVVFQFDTLNGAFDLAYADACVVTIVRDPVSLFESLYDEYRREYSLGSFKDFVSKVIKNEFNLTANPTSTRLGLSQKYNYEEAEIEEFILKVERTFDLVMIDEQLDASLVLLANLMGWSLEHVTYVPPSVTELKYNFSVIERNVIAKLNFVDVKLYDHFLKKFENCAIQYGVNELLNEMNTLAVSNELIRQYCWSPEDFKDNQKFWNCENYMRNEQQIVQQLQREQSKRIEEKKILDYVIIH